MLTSREFKAMEKGKIITKISIYGSDGDLIKTLPLEQARQHKCIVNESTRTHLFTPDEAKKYIMLGLADNFASVQGEKNLVHCINYIDRTYGNLIHQSMLLKLSIEQIKEKNYESSKNI